MNSLRIELPEDVLAELVERVAAVVLGRLAEEAPAVRSEYLTVVEAAELLRASRQRVYDLLSARKLAKYRDGARVLVRRTELDEYLAIGSGRVAPRLPHGPRRRMNPEGSA